MDFLINFAPLIGGALTLLTGLAALAAPALLGRFLCGAGAVLPAVPAVRLLVGGPLSALGAFSLVSRSPSAFWAVGFIWFGALLVRVIQANLGGQPYAWRPRAAGGPGIGVAAGFLCGQFRLNALQRCGAFFMEKT